MSDGLPLVEGSTVGEWVVRTAVANARAAGITVVESDVHTLLCDLDTPASVIQFDRVMRVIRSNYDVAGVQRWYSKSGNIHAKVTLRNSLPFVERVALQAALGSDGVREVLGIVRERQGQPDPSVLFKPADAKVPL